MVNFNVNKENPLRVTFVDTPGQDIFFRMRNYGAEVADFAIIMVSAEDGVLSPLTFTITIEVIGINPFTDWPSN